MNSVMRSKTLKYFIAIAFFYSPYSFGSTLESCKSQSDQIKKTADKGKATATKNQINFTDAVGATRAGKVDIHQNAKVLCQTSDIVGDYNLQSASTLDGLTMKCQEACNTTGAKPTEVKAIAAKAQECQDYVKKIVTDVAKSAFQAKKTARQACQTANAALGGAPSERPNGGGGMSPMMAGLLGAALGGGLGYMMGKKKGEKDKDKDKKDEDVVADDGTVDCTKSGAEAYSDCNSYFESKCAADLSAEGCSGFTARYCSAAPSGSNDTSSDTVSTASASDKDITGEGLSTQFCFTAQATSFCEAAGRETCPSCLQLEANKAEVCQSNPALCLMQNSPAEIEAAKNSCPSDPMFSNPDYVAGGGATVENADTLEDPILPGQYASSSSSSEVGGIGESAPSDTAGSGGNASSSGAASDVADGSASSSGSGSSGSGVIGSSPSDVAAGGSVSDPVLPTGGLNFASANGSRTPASVGEKMGPSLFSMSSAMIESRCKNAQLAHCSK